MKKEVLSFTAIKLVVMQVLNFLCLPFQSRYLSRFSLVVVAALESFNVEKNLFNKNQSPTRAKHFFDGIF